MNQSQRKFLMDTLKEKSRNIIDELEKKKAQKPQIKNYLLKEVMKGTLKMQPSEVIEKHLKGRAMDDPENWLHSGNHRFFSGDDTCLEIPLLKIFVAPESYIAAMEEYKQQNGDIDAQIRTIQENVSSLCMRIQLANDKTLDRLIAEVDNIGDLSMMDFTLKSIMSGTTENKFLEK